MESEGSSKRSQVSLHVEDAHNEEEQIAAIEHEIDDLIKEDTYPVVLQFLRDIDTKYMMPMFKRPFNENGESMMEMGETMEEMMEAEGGDEDKFFKVQNDSDNIQMGH